MKKIFLSAVVIALAATACTKSNDSAPAKKETTVYIILDAPDNDNMTSTTTAYKKFTVKH